MNNPTRRALFAFIALLAAIVGFIASGIPQPVVPNPGSVILPMQPAFAQGVPTPTIYTLVVTIVGNGTVTQQNLTNNITTTVSPMQYLSGTVVALTASPASGWTFNGWTGDVVGLANPQNVTMTANRNVTANFTQAQNTSTPTATSTATRTSTSTTTPTQTATSTPTRTSTSAAPQNTATTAPPANTDTPVPPASSSSTPVTPFLVVPAAVTPTVSPTRPARLPSTGVGDSYLLMLAAGVALMILVFLSRYIRRTTT